MPDYCNRCGRELGLFARPSKSEAGQGIAPDVRPAPALCTDCYAAGATSSPPSESTFQPAVAPCDSIVPAGSGGCGAPSQATPAAPLTSPSSRLWPASSAQALTVGTAGLLCVAAVFGSWLKYMQLSYVSSSLPVVYPSNWSLADLAIVFLVVAITWIGWCAIFRPFLDPREFPSFLLIDASAYLPLLLPVAGVPFGVSLAAVIGARALNVALRARRLAMPWDAILHHLMAFLTIFLCHLAFNQIVSPVSWCHAPTQSPFLNASTLWTTQYTNAKFLSLSDLDHAFWGSMPRSFAYYSLPVAVLALLFDAPSLDPIWFTRLVMIVVFTLSVAGSFGFYLFLRQGIRLCYPVSVLGGILFYFSNIFFVETLAGSDYLAFISVYLCLPYSLLFCRLAFRKSSVSLAGLSGLAFAVPFYAFASHPDAVIHGSFFIACYFIYQVIFNREAPSASRRIQLGLAALLVALGGSVAYLAPFIFASYYKELLMVGHGGNGYVFCYKRNWHGFGLVFHNVLQPLLNSVDLLFVLGLTQGYHILRDKEKRGDFLFFLGMFLWYLYFIISGDSGFFAKKLAQTTNQISFLSTHYRLSIYLSLTALVLALAGLDSIVGMRNHRANAASWIVMGAISAVILGGVSLWGISPTISLLGVFLFVATLPSLAAHGHLNGVTRAFAVLPFAVLTLSFLPAIPWLRGTTPLPYNYFQPNVNPFASRSLVGDSPLYHSLQAMLAQYPLLQKDERNWRFIREHLERFEEDALSSPQYEEYRLALKALGCDSASALSRSQVLAVARRTYPVVDTFYLRTLGKSAASAAASSYFIETGPYQRAFGMSADSSGLVGNGLLSVNVSSLPLDAQFMSVYPLLQALYIAPEPRRLFRADWNAWVLSPEQVLRAETRRLLDIAGADLFLLPQRDYDALGNDLKVELVPVTPRTLPPGGATQYQLLQNNRSYGLAYLATRVMQVAPSIVDRFTNTYAFPVKPGSPLESTILGETEKLREKLLTLRGRYDAVIEEPGLAKSGEDLVPLPEGNSLAIEGFIGPRCALKVHCDRAPCVLVLNMAAITGWHAFSDGDPLPIKRANFAFMSVDVPAGEHLIWFEYRPGFSFACEVASLLTLLVCMTTLFLRNPLPAGGPNEGVLPLEQRAPCG